MTTSSHFLCGVIEGFYGKPWSGKERQCLFQRMQSMQLNAYMYAPKDDNKHRCDWRVLYTAKETEKLRSLIQAADAAGVTFIYALSPGLDMAYSSQLPLLLRKLAQVRQLGCRAFALLFDDIEPRLRGPDRAAFKSPAEAQCAVTNAAYEHLGRPSTFLFCPTEYCASRARPSVAKSPYLATLGSKLAAGIGVLWTGPRVVSKTITAASIKEVGEAIRRKPIIWDNLHANDYDMSRLFLGPFSGRNLDLAPLLDGVLTNPNCQFEANFIAMNTLAQWHRCAMQADNDSGSSYEYVPEAALERAVRDWLPLFLVAGGSSAADADDDRGDDSESGDGGGGDGGGGDGGAGPSTPLPADEGHEAALIDSDAGCTPDPEAEEDLDNASSSSSSSGDGSSEEAVCRTPISYEELLRVCHLFYLPYMHGDWAVRLLDEFHWLRVFSASANPGQRPSDWSVRAAAFDQELASLRLVRRKLNMLANRSLALDLFRYVGDVCSVLGTLSNYLRARESADSQQPPQAAFSTSPSSSALCRGGLAAELQRLLPPDAARSLLLHRVFAVRRCASDVDRGALAELVCCTEPRTRADSLLELCCIGEGNSATAAAAAAADSVGDSAGFVLEDAFGVCAFACVVPCDGKSAATVDFLPAPASSTVRSPPTSPPPPHPSLLHFAVSPCGRCDLSLESKARPLRRLMSRCLDALADSGADWAHCLLPAGADVEGSNPDQVEALASDLCRCLGFERRDCPQATQCGWQLLVRSLM